MSEYLSKEEVRQWRSSLEKITLEEFAARLGKKIETEKETRDLVDIVMKTQNEPIHYIDKRISSEPLRTVSTIKVPDPKVQIDNIRKTEDIVLKKKPEIKEEIITEIKKPLKNVSPETGFTFNKKLTDREQAVLEHFVKNKGKTVLVKDLADLLDLPRDYVYKYIKTLRSKIDQDVLVNSERGGYIFNN